jgi:phage terminase small subunit
MSELNEPNNQQAAKETITSQEAQSNTLDKELPKKVIPRKVRRLTAKQEGFVKDFLETKNASEAVRRNYDITNVNSASVIGTENLANLSIQERIKTLKSKYIEDSFSAYEKQKEIMLKTDNEELINKIANKIQDRAGFTPVYRQENKTMSVKYSINRGND